MPHNFQRQEMTATGVRYTVDSLDEIGLELGKVDARLAAGTPWTTPAASFE